MHRQRAITDRALELAHAGVKPIDALVQAVMEKGNGCAPQVLELAAKLFTKALKRQDARGRILPTRDRNGRFRAA
ncbi:MAG: hypothetical protein VYA51_12970 [Planctomycetota bacterium]|nr:hypothetical protein [Planctomycetota bacterium]